MINNVNNNSVYNIYTQQQSTNDKNNGVNIDINTKDDSKLDTKNNGVNIDINTKDDSKLDTSIEIEERSLSKIDLLKQRIQNGEYQVNLDNIANSIADELLP